MSNEIWRVVCTVLLSIISSLLVIIYRDFVIRLARVENKLGTLAIALLAVIIKMNPIPDEVVKALSEVLKEK